MEMEFSKLEKLVGTFIIGVILLLMAILIIIGRGKDWFESYKTYYTNFNESYNLQKNAEVKLFKANIGKVTDIALNEDRVRVRLEILERYASRIRQDAIAIVESPTLIGSEYISIIPGSSDSPRIEEGGEIQSREKRSINDILAEFEVEKTAKMVIEGVQNFSELTTYLNHPAAPLRMSLDNIQLASEHLVRITADLDAGKGVLGALVKSEALLGQVETSITRLNDILSSIEQAAAQTPHTMELVQENLSVYRQSGNSLNARMNEAQIVIEEINRAMADLQVILANIKIGSSEIPKIATTFRDGIKEIREGVEQVNRVVDSMQQNVLIRSNLSEEPRPQGIDAGARP
jgi:phospholipid/cholesterol/gamma-HCH transport system substrate-binding protein